MNWNGSQTKLLVGALGVTAIFLLGVAHDSWVAGRVIPSLLRYIPPGSEGYVVTGPLADLWSNAEKHPYAAAFLTASSAGQGDFGNVASGVAHQCIQLSTSESLAANGIDPTRGATLAIIAGQSHDYVAVIPVRDQNLFTKFIQVLLSPWHQVTFVAAASAQPVRRLRISSNASSNVRFCNSNNGEPVDLTPGATLENKTSYSVVVDDNGAPASISISCAAEYSDGSAGACQCVSDGSDCSHGLALSAPKPLQARDFPVKGLTAVTSEMTGVGSVFLTYPDPHTGLVAINAQSAKAALDFRKNFLAFQSDDSLRIALRQILGDTSGQGVIFGAETLAYPPIFGSAHFSTIITNDRITGQVFLPWQPIEQTVLSHVISTTPSPERLDETVSQFGEIQASDPYLGEYFKYFKSYFPKKFDAFSTFFKNFKDAVEGIASEGGIKKLALSYHGRNDGADHFLMSLKFTQQEADAFILNQRQATRTVRDIKILQGAAESFATDHGGAASTTISDLLPYLADESDAMWSRYTIRPPGQGQTKPLINAGPTPMPSDFDSDAYNKLVDGHPFKFISPKFTLNDKNFRLEGGELSDQAISNLESDRFRMVAYYDTATEQLIVATDEATLSSYVARSTAGEFQQSAKEHYQQIKLRLDANPQLIYTQMLNNPALSDEERKNIQDAYGEVAKYRGLNLSFEPRPEENGLFLSWSANRD